LTFEQWYEHTPAENKLELTDGDALWEDERERMALALVYNMGMEYFVSILPEESKQALKELLSQL
jgi:hypothetical protein